MTRMDQLKIFGIPDALDTPDIFTPTPWERYHYSPNDLAGTTHPTENPVPESVW
ncbi:MAG TPA: hypothetical protein VKY29_05855 [Cryomorphaceae bacterium]|nr:hypothetical protein [Cryomorphaceae bacterium]